MAKERLPDLVIHTDTLQSGCERMSQVVKVFFPSTYRQYCHLLGPNQAYLVTGLVEEHFATMTLTVTRLRLFSALASEE